jgi:hypothetical protein
MIVLTFQRQTVIPNLRWKMNCRRESRKWRCFKWQWSTKCSDGKCTSSSELSKGHESLRIFLSFPHQPTSSTTDLANLSRQRITENAQFAATNDENAIVWTRVLTRDKFREKWKSILWETNLMKSEIYRFSPYHTKVILKRLKNSLVNQCRRHIRKPCELGQRPNENSLS